MIHLRELGASLLISGTVLALFNGAMFAGRLLNVTVVARAGARVSIKLSGYGILLATILLIPSNVITTAAAFVVLGLAVAGVLPTTLGTSARLAATHATAMSTIILEAAFIGYIVTPPLIGWGASLMSLHTALVLVLGASGLTMLGLVRAIPVEVARHG